MLRLRKRRKPKFLLGVGAQKAGTSFLHGALEASPEVALSRPKELHVLDCYFRPELTRAHGRVRRMARALLEREPPGPGGERTAWKLRRALMLYDLNEYVRYFRERVDGFSLTGDITPSYSILNESHFREVRGLLEEDFDIRVIFIMRDPLERIFSAMRMQDRESGAASPSAAERFPRQYANTGQELRTRYERIVPRLENVFGEERIYFGFYESLFQRSTFIDIERFLGAPVPLPDLTQRVNASPREQDLPGAAIRAAREYYSETYEFCRRRFPDAGLESLWPHMSV